VPADAEYLPTDFSDPWEHIRLLSDRARNDALVRMLQRRAPGARVLEVGCGTGLLSCVAAKLGATHVHAVEQTNLADQAHELVLANGLQDRVTVTRGSIEDLAPQPVDLVFSELLNADPFFEGVMPAMEAGARWLVPGGILSPRRLKVYVALAWASEPAEEYAAATAEVKRIGGECGLELRSLLEALDVRHPMRWVTHAERPVSTVACAFDLPIGGEAPPPLEAQVQVWSRVEGAVGGALVWFSAEVDDELWMSNPPGAGTHWGQMVCGWTRPLPVRSGERVALQIRRIGSEIVVAPVV
jgi:SAM-dependent methyltransferase